LYSNQTTNDMENLKIMKTVTSENRPSFNEWAKELRVSSEYYIIGEREFRLKQKCKPKEETIWERINKIFGI
jgi:hypothetical protein